MVNEVLPRVDICFSLSCMLLQRTFGSSSLRSFTFFIYRAGFSKQAHLLVSYIALRIEIATLDHCLYDGVKYLLRVIAVTLC